jgi:tRNA pseudouridine55 synthase
VTIHDVADALAFADEGDETPLRDVVAPAERALVHLPRLTIAPSAAEQVATGAPVYAPGVIDAESARAPVAEVGTGPLEQGALVACYTPDGSAVCLGRLVGDPEAARGEVVALERVLV